MKENAKLLELDKVLEKVSTYAVISRNKNKILDLDYHQDYFKVEEDLIKTKEILHYVYKYGRLSIQYGQDLSDSLLLASKNATLNIKELYDISNQNYNIKQIQDYCSNIDFIENSYLRKIVNELVIINEITNQVDWCISNDLNILDRASGTLKNIRKQLKGFDDQIKDKLNQIIHSRNDMLAESLVTIRNDHYVVPVKVSYKNNFRGIIYDESKSGETVYIEPEEITQLNAKYQQLKNDEKKEIERILKELSDLVYLHIDQLKINFNIILEIDYLFAKAAFGKDYNGCVASLSTTKKIELVGARHPLIDTKKVVANDFYLGDEYKEILLISGPNTGGKSVALKTIGLLIMMNQCGLPLPCNDHACLSIFNEIFIDIGDEQNIIESLSTFSSHMTRLIHIIENVSEKSLVLVDELGSGTDPKEGEALAMSFIDYLNEKGSFGVISTHYSNLKKFALSSNYIENASMEFSEKDLKPTYHIKYNIYGNSYAFEIASSLNFPKYLIEKAIKYKEYYESTADKILNNLQEEKEKLELERLRLLDIEKDLNIKIEEANRIKKELEDENIRIKQKADELVSKLASEYLEKMEELFNEAKDGQGKLHEIISARTKLNKYVDSLNEEVDNSIHETIELQVGDDIYVKSLNMKGKIIRVNKDEYVISNNSITINVKKYDVVKDKSIKPKAISKVERKFKAVDIECNLIGMRVEEARSTLDKYISDCLVANYKQVRIIHGVGTFALAKMVHEYLKNNKHVEKYFYANAYEGGAGATIVILK